MEKSGIMELFGVKDTVSIREYHGGHINSTYLAECAGGEKYILQSLSREVFSDHEAVMDNIAVIGKAFLKSGDSRVCVPEYLITEQGRNFAQCGEEIFRVYRYRESADFGRDSFRKAGFSFGSFIRILSGKNIRLKETVSGLHDFSAYFVKLKKAATQSPMKKIDSSVISRLENIKEMTERIFTSDFPVRNVHNDAKTDNVVFSEVCTVIDLDTAMKGYAATDYGDLVRSVCSDGNFSYDRIKAVTEGFAEGLGGILCSDEIYSLYYGVLYVTAELAVRYLIDYLSEEHYFKDKTPAECLKRANDLLDRLNMFAANSEDITSIIYKAFGK